MSFRLIAFHYRRTEHADEMVERVARATEVIGNAPGCLDIDYWRDESSDAIVATAKFESKATCVAALSSAAATVDIAYDDRETRPRDVYHLVEPSSTPTKSHD